MTLKEMGRHNGICRATFKLNQERIIVVHY
jgi:hypothetical protein